MAAPSVLSPADLPRISNLATSLQTTVTNAEALRSSHNGLARSYPAMKTTTFGQKLSIFVNQSVGSMSLSPANRDVVLAARKGLFIVDLESPFEPPRFLAQLSTWEAADVQWSPHPARAHWVASTSNNRLLIWNLDRPEGAPREPPSQNWAVNIKAGKKTVSAGGSSSSSLPLDNMSMGSGWTQPYQPLAEQQSFPRSSAVEHVLSAGHTRAITDINWSAHHPDILASCGIDAWSWVWDVRTPGRPVKGFSAWNAGATQIKWNRSSPHRLATAVTNKVLIWDDRKGALPLATIEAHENQIYGLDWSRDTTNAGLDRLSTCSLDGAVKFWDLASPASQEAIGSRSLVTEPEQIIQTSTPIWRARHLPFGKGVMTLPQRGDTTLSMWSKDHPEDGPVERFVGHKDLVKEYLFRTRGGGDRTNDDRQFQLITWSKDQTLRLWPVSEEVTKKVGHKPGAPINILQTRKGAKDISFREPPHLKGEAARRASLDQRQDSIESPQYRTSILPPTEASNSLISGRRSSAARPSAGHGSPSSAGAHSDTGARPSSVGLLSSSLKARMTQMSASQGDSISMLSKSFPKSLSAGRSYGGQPQSFGSAMTSGPDGSYRRGSLDTKRSTGKASAGNSAFVAPMAGRTGATALTLPSRHDNATTKEANAAARAKKRSKRLAQGAASTYMTRGSGAVLGADLLRMKLSSNTAGGSRRRNDAVSWISGVKVDKLDQRGKSQEAARTTASGSKGGQHTSGPQARPGTAGRMASDGAIVRRSHSFISRTAGDVEDADRYTLDLQSEVLEVSKAVPQITFEKIDIDKSTCTLSLYGPWAHRGDSVYMRLSLQFASTSTSSSGTSTTTILAIPTFQLEHNASVSLRTRAFLLRSIRTVLNECHNQETSCLEPCARFLSGSPTVAIGEDVVLAGARPPIKPDNGSGEGNENVSEGEEEEETREDRVGAEGPAMTAMIRMLVAARCGARFSASGHLVCFNAVSKSSRPTSHHHHHRQHQQHQVDSSRFSSRLSSNANESMDPLSRASSIARLATTAPSAVASQRSGPINARRGGAGGNATASRPGGRFLHSYAELTRAMDSLNKMEQEQNGGGRSTVDYDQDESTLLATAGQQAPELLCLMSSDFLARRLQARSDSKHEAATRRSNLADSTSNAKDTERRGRWDRNSTDRTYTSLSNAEDVTTRTPTIGGAHISSSSTRQGTPRSRSVAAGGRDLARQINNSLPTAAGGIKDNPYSRHYHHFPSSLIPSGKTVHHSSEIKIFKIDFDSLGKESSSNPAPPLAASEQVAEGASEGAVAGRSDALRNSKPEDWKRSTSVARRDSQGGRGAEAQQRPSQGGRKRSSSSPMTLASSRGITGASTSASSSRERGERGR